MALGTSLQRYLSPDRGRDRGGRHRVSSAESLRMLVVAESGGAVAWSPRRGIVTHFEDNPRRHLTSIPDPKGCWGLTQDTFVEITGTRRPNTAVNGGRSLRSFDARVPS